MAVTESLFRLRLRDGLPTRIDAREHRYHGVVLRETTIGDEAKAVQLAERVVQVPGQGFRLLSSEDTYARAMVMLAIDRFEGDGGRTLDGPAIDLDLIGKLSRQDWTAIEARVLLIEASAEVRHGAMSEAQFAALEKAAGLGPRESAGQAGELASPAGEPGPPPQLLSERS